MDNISFCCNRGPKWPFPRCPEIYYLACSIYEIQKAVNTLKKDSGLFTKHYPSVTGSVLALQQKGSISKEPLSDFNQATGSLPPLQWSKVGLCKDLLQGTHTLSLLSTLFSLYRLGLVLFLNTERNYTDAAKIRIWSLFTC